MIMRQIKFRDKDLDEVLGGILCQRGIRDYIICGCCGAIVEADDPGIEILEVYKAWADISDSILGDQA